MIKSSSKTSTDLKMKTIVCSFSRLTKQPLFWLALLLTLVAISILVNLGMWQLDRASHKHQLQVELENNQQKPLQSLGSIEFVGNLNGTVALANLTPIAGYYLLLDNQTYNGEVGYLALQLMRSSDSKYFLFEMGFSNAPAARTDLPVIEWLSRQYVGEVRLYRRSANPLSDQLMIEETQPRRIQNLNLEQLASYWQLPLESYVLQPLVANWRYPQPWQPIPMGAEKHTGYAVQWFAMALALAVIGVIWLRRAMISSTKESL